jgi:glycosyltransferase involved in cell wall biosynthesis
MCERLKAARTSPSRAKAWISYQKARIYEQRLLRRYDLALVVCQHEKTHTLELAGPHGPRVEVLSNGVDCERNRPGLYVPQPHRLVFNGALTYSANYDAMQWFLSAIFPLIRAGCPDTEIAITGRTSSVDLSGLALTSSVRLTGYVDDVREPVGEAEVCVVPLRQGGGTRLKILEAMALGTPVVSTTKGAEGLSVTHGENIVIADQPEEFAQQTLRLLSNQAERQRLAANARRLVEDHYNWTRIGCRFAELVEETVRSTVATHTHRQRAGAWD